MGCTQSKANEPNEEPKGFSDLQAKQAQPTAQEGQLNGGTNKRYATANSSAACSASGSGANGIAALPALHQELVFSLAPGPDQTFLSGSEDRTLNWFDATALKGQLVKAHERAITDIVYAQSLKQAFTCSRDKTIKQWELGSAIKPIQTFQGHSLPIAAIDVNQANPTQLVSGGRDYQLRFWDISTGQCQFWTDIQQNVITDIRWIEGEECVLQASEDLSLRVWDVRTREAVQTFSDGPYFALQCDISADHNYFLTGHNGFEGVGCELKLFDRRMNKKLMEIQAGQQALTDSCFLHHTPLGQLVALSASKDASLKVWNLDEILRDSSVALADQPTEVGLLASTYLEQNESVQSLCGGSALDRDRTQFATGHVNGRISCWEFNAQTRSIKLTTNAPGASE